MRLLAFLILIFVIVWLPWWVLLLYCCWYAGRFFAIELLLVAACLDVYFGVAGIPYYTLSATGLVLSIELARPYLTQKVY